jgi:hypothetical protein
MDLILHCFSIQIDLGCTRCLVANITGSYHHRSRRLMHIYLLFEVTIEVSTFFIHSNLASVYWIPVQVSPRILVGDHQYRNFGM